VLTILALGKENIFLKICLPSAPLPGTRQRKKIEKFFAKCPTAGHSAKKKNLILCRVPTSPALGKFGKLAQIGFVFLALPSVFGIALSKGCRQSDHNRPIF
jgi:hypothetical protein